jgi:hypothetical protein
MSSRRREPDDEQFADDAETGAEDVFRDYEFDDIGPVDAEELDWDTGSQSGDEQEDTECTADSNEVRGHQESTAGSNLPPEALARLQERRPELERVANSDLPAEAIATELLRILNQQSDAA